MTPSKNPDSDGFDRINPVPLQPSTVTPVAAPAQAGGSNSQRPVKIALLLLVVLLLGVIFVLPQLTGSGAQNAALPESDTAESADPQVTGDQATANTTSAESAAAPLDAEAGLAARQKAQDTSQQLDLRRSKLEERAVTRWAAEPYAELSAKYAQAEQHFRDRDFATATAIWQDAILDADNLLEQSGWELLGATQTGQQGLDEGNSALAKQGFELALAIDPMNKLAQAGLIRANRLDDVMALYRTAQRYEQEKNLIAARDTYAQALKLDPATISAAAGYARTHTELQNREFRRLISAALKATDAGQFNDARKHYQSAAEIKKDAVEISEGLAAISVAEQARAVRLFRREGARLEAKEQWAQAAAQYRQALTTDSTLTFAKSGAARAEQRAKLDSGLQTIIEDPDTLFDEKVQQRAKALLEQAQAASPQGPRLRGQINWMQQALPLATTPVPVQLISDNRTDVLLYKVGKLGRFDRKNLSLKPGDYTAIGRCDGFRDERVIFSIRPNQQTSTAVDIRCRESI